MHQTGTVPTVVELPSSEPASAVEALLERLSSFARLHEIAQVDLFHPALTAALDTVCAGAVGRVGHGGSLVSVVLDSAQVVLGSSGVGGELAVIGGIPAEWAPCARTVVLAGPYLVADASSHPDFRDSPLVTRQGIRGYAGVPIVLGDQVVGAHSLVSSAPIGYDSAALDVLADGAVAAAALLRAHQRPLLRLDDLR